MSLQLRATRHQLADIKRLCSLETSVLDRVKGRLELLSQPLMKPQQLLAEVSKEIDSQDAEKLVRQLLALQGIVRQSGLSVDEVFNGVKKAIEQQGGEVELSVGDWGRIEPVLKSLVNLKGVRIAATAIELAYDYANLLKRTKILTDIRPLYDEPADAIEGAVVSYTLRLRYDSADNDHELSIALDENDIKVLMKQCERALKKAATARALLTKCNVPSSISGESIND